MKGIKCLGILSLFFITAFVSLNVSLDASALKHNLTGIELGNRSIGFIVSNGDGTYRFQTEKPSGDYREIVYYNNVLSVSATGSARFTEFENYKLSNNLSFLNLWDDGDSCSLYLSGGAVRSMVDFSGSSSSGYSYNIGGSFYSHTPETAAAGAGTLPRNCYIHNKFGTNKPSFNFGSLSNISGYLTCGVSNGASCSGVWDARSYINNEILPDYFYTTDGLYFNKSIQSVDGNIYSNNFSFNQVFDGDLDYLPKFSLLNIPIGNINYFTNSDNLYSGRQFKFSGSFMFEGSFSWNPSIQDTGHFDLFFSGYTKYGNRVTRTYECSTNLIDVPGASYRELQYTCDFTLDSDYLYLIPYLYIYNNDSYVWETNDYWYFNSSYWVTDNDDTSGAELDPNITGGSHAPGAPYLPEDSPGSISDFFESLTNLFNFNFINPFAPLFDMFNSNDNCASIPTLAGMIHSEESTVCPWFDSSVRSIVTPVLSLSSMMLIFGFAVRWLGASDSFGGLFTDSAGEEVSNQGGKWGHFKKGKG